MTSFMNTFMDKKMELLNLFLEHVQLTTIAVCIAILIAVPLGIFITKHKKLAGVVIGCVNLIQAIPSLAILGFLIPFLGIGSTPAIFMVVLYSMLPILKNTYTSISNINPDMIEAATGIGMTPRQILFRVKIPLAIPIMMAGIRISAVTSVGLMTVAAFIGAGGLGYLVYSGIQTVNNDLILLGAIPAALLALMIDFGVGKIESMVTPNGIKLKDGAVTLKRPMSPLKKKILATLAIVFVASGIYTTVSSRLNASNTVTIGSKGFTEQLVLGNMYADLIEANTDLNVNRQLGLGGTSILFEAMKSGDADLYIEYTGTALLSILNEENTFTSPDALYNHVKTSFADQYDIQVLKPLGFNNTYALAVTQAFADEYDLTSISDLVPLSKDFVLSPTIEFANREDGYLGMKKVYNVNFKSVTPLEGSLRYTAIANNEAQVISAFATDGLLVDFDLVVLEDDASFFPAYSAVPFVRNETLEKHPELEAVLNELNGVLTDDVMRDLNYKVDVEKQDPARVARDFLMTEGYIN